MGSFLLLFSCKKESIALKNSPKDETQIESVSREIKLETFGFPPEVEGCSCYFAKNKEDFNAEKYLYIDDYGNNAYLKIGGKLLKIEMDEDDFDPADFSKKIKNDRISIEIKGKKVDELEEVMMFEGTMNVENNKGEKATTTIYGECGC